MPAIALLILAAGASSRMAGNQPKQLLPYHGRSLLRHAAETALASQCSPVVVVLGARAARLRQELIGLPLQIIIADHWERGMGASIHAGMAAVETDDAPLDGVIITLCDQPLLTAEHIEALIAVSREQKNALVASEYGGTLGVPALFPRAMFSELRALPEAQGAKPILQRHASHAVSVPFPHGTLDIDTIEDYRDLIIETTED